MLLCVSVSVAIRFTLSPLNPFAGSTTNAVGVNGTVKVFVLFDVAYILSCRNSASMLYVPLFCSMVYAYVLFRMRQLLLDQLVFRLH